MKSYIHKPLTTKKNSLFNSKSLSPYSYRMINYKNTNIEVLQNLLVENKKGFEPGSDNYISFSENYFIRIGDMSDNDFIITQNKNTIKIKPITTKSLLKKGDVCYQTASNVGNVCIYDGKDAYYNSHIRKLSFKKDKFYIFAFLKSSFCRNQVDIGGSIKGVDNFSEAYLLNTFIPYPTQKHNKSPKDVVKLISLITQNIIDKEEQIKFKNQLIDSKIEKELKVNQKSKAIQYSYSKLSELKKEKRLDSGLYEKNYKLNKSLIENYKYGFFNINFKDIKTGQTPKDYYYPKSKYNNQIYNWITPKNIKNNVLYSKLYIHTKANTTLKNFDIIFGSRGSVGDVFLYDESILGKSYINQSTSGVTIKGELDHKVFVLCYFSSSIFKNMMQKYIYDGTVPAITPDVLSKFIIPKFPKEKEKEIAKSYYNKVDELTNISLDNYLTKHKKRNQKLGIFQLNMEIFELKEKLENLVDKIVMNEKIIIGKYL